MTAKDLDLISKRLQSARLVYSQKRGEADRFHGWIDNYPFWAWIKRYETTQGVGLYRMLRFSNRYGMDLVGPDFYRYRNKFDHEFYPAGVAASFHASDEKVRATMVSNVGAKSLSAYQVRERFKSPLDGRLYEFVGEKWAYAVNDEILVAGRGRGQLVSDGGGTDEN